MKQFVFMSIATAIGTLGIVISPFYGVAVYYLFAVLRPQFMWEWSLPKDVQWSFYVAVATIAAVLCGLRGRATIGPRYTALTSSQCWVLGFGAWVCFTFCTAMNSTVAYPQFIEYLKIFTMFGISAIAIRTVRHTYCLIVIASLALAYIAYEINFLYFFNHYLGVYHNGYGGLDNNGAGLMLAMGIPGCFYLWDATAGWRRWFFLALVPVLVHAVLMTYSRGAMLSIMLVSPLCIVRCRHRVQVLGFLLLFLFIGLPALAGKEIQERFFSIQKFKEDGSASSRFTSWKIALRIASENPVFGVGIRNSNLLTYRYGADINGRTIHNQYLQTAADSGFPAVALYVAALGSTWLATIRCRRMVRGMTSIDAKQAHLVCDCVEGSLAVFAVGAMFLSLETFELTYLLLLIGGALPAVIPASVPEIANAIGMRQHAARRGETWRPLYTPGGTY